VTITLGFWIEDGYHLNPGAKIGKNLPKIFSPLEQVIAGIPQDV